MTQRQRESSRQHDIIDLGETSGDAALDSRTVFREPLTAGRFGVGLWDGHDHRLLVSDTIALGSEAMVARHLQACHRPADLGTPEISVCETATCEQARTWAVAVAAEQIDAVSS